MVVTRPLPPTTWSYGMNSWGSVDGPTLNNDNALPDGRPSGAIIRWISAIIYSSKFPRTLRPHRYCDDTRNCFNTQLSFYRYHFHWYRHRGSFASQNRPSSGGGGKPFYDYRLEKKEKVGKLPSINYHYYFNTCRWPNIWTDLCITNINSSQRGLSQIRFFSSMSNFTGNTTLLHLSLSITLSFRLSFPVFLISLSITWIHRFFRPSARSLFLRFSFYRWSDRIVLASFHYTSKPLLSCP